MGEKAVDISLTILEGAIAIAGLTLVYSAFLVARAHALSCRAIDLPHPNLTDF